MIGKSWVKMLAGEEESPRSGQDYLAWEIFGNRAVRQGDWKLVWEYKPYGTEQWELFNLDADSGERHNLAAEQPEKAKTLLALWDDYARANKVVLPSRVIWEQQAKQLPDRYPVVDGYPPALYQKQFVPPANMMADPKP
jgi:arylsulfatase